MPVSSPLVEFPSGPLAQPLGERRSHWYSSLSAVATRDLDRYYAALRHELCAAHLSEGEAAALCEVLHGTFVDAESAWSLPVEVEDALGDGLADRWEIDGPVLVARLQAMPWSRLLAIVDAVERWWALPADEKAPFPDGLRRIGLLPDDDPAT